MCSVARLAAQCRRLRSPVNSPTELQLSLSQYAISTKNVQYQQGTLLNAIRLMVIDEQPEPVSLKDIMTDADSSMTASNP